MICSVRFIWNFTLLCTFLRYKEDDNNNKNENNLSNKSETLDVDEDNAYAVFITYIEVYNNSVYDLLEENDGKAKWVKTFKIVNILSIY